MWVKASNHAILDVSKAESVGTCTDVAKNGKVRYSVRAQFPKVFNQNNQPILIQSFDTLSEAETFLDDILAKLNAKNCKLEKVVHGMDELNKAFADGWNLDKKIDPGNYPGNFKISK